MAMKAKLRGMGSGRKLETVLLIFYVSGILGLWAGLIETQSFSDSASANAAGWTNFNTFVSGNNYGFSTNDLDGGASGSAGGFIARGGVPSYYADLTIGGTF